MGQEENKNAAHDPHEDSIVTANHHGGKKIDADPSTEAGRPAENDNLVSEGSQKGKAVDADVTSEKGKPTAE